MRVAKTYPLRLPQSLKGSVERLSREDGTSINQFVVTAVAEKVSALRTARFFEDRKARGGLQGFRQDHAPPKRKAAPRRG